MDSVYGPASNPAQDFMQGYSVASILRDQVLKIRESQSWVLHNIMRLFDLQLLSAMLDIVHKYRSRRLPYPAPTTARADHESTSRINH